MPGSRSDCKAEMQVEIDIAKQAADVREWFDALNHFAQAVQIAVKYYPWPENFHNEIDTLLSRCVGYIGGQMIDASSGISQDSYISFKLLSRGEKTSKWGVYSKHHGNLLGIIAWWGAWRQYVFIPDGNTMYSRGCMREIGAFIQEQMEERKKGACGT